MLHLELKVMGSKPIHAFFILTLTWHAKLNCDVIG